MRSGPLSTAFFALFFAVPVLACAGAGSVVDLIAPTPAPVVEATPAPLPPVLIGPDDFGPAVAGTTTVAASEQPGSEPMAKKKAKAKEKDKAAPKAAKPKGPQSGVAGAAANYGSFVAARDAVAMDSEKSAALFVQALIVYTLDQDLGHEMISTMLKPKDMKEDSDAASGFHLGMGTRDDLLQLLKKQYIMPGYCGGTPQKEYKDADVKNCTLSFDKEYSSRMQGEGYKTPDHAKYFITNGGSPYPRPMELNLMVDEATGKERWHIKNFAGLLTGVTRPEDLD
jgi:hypothetical protein